jgi:hypothetical protein
MKKIILYFKSRTYDEMKEDVSKYLKEETLIVEKSTFKENWDFLIMITACWNVFMLPIAISFGIQSEVTSYIDWFVDWCFVIDMIVVFRTTIVDEDSGNEIRDNTVIAWTYLKGRFFIDVLSTVPFDSMALMFMEVEEAKKFKLLGVLKLIRVMRLNKIIMYLNVKQDIKAVS